MERIIFRWNGNRKRKEQKKKSKKGRENEAECTCDRRIMGRDNVMAEIDLARSGLGKNDILGGHFAGSLLLLTAFDFLILSFFLKNINYYPCYLSMNFWMCRLVAFKYFNWRCYASSYPFDPLSFTHAAIIICLF